jgi:hypothetical protein
MVDQPVAEVAKICVEVPGLRVGICPRIRRHRLEVTPDLLQARLQLGQEQSPQVR